MENKTTRARWATSSSKLVPVVVATAIACTYGFAVIGPRVVNPLDLTWMNGDTATAYIGWAFFRQEQHLTFPLAWSGSLGYPFGEPAAYLDSIPIVAVLSWFINQLFHREFQYFGIYFLICCALQFYFGFRIGRRIGLNEINSILAASLFLIAPPFIWRAYGHFALASHWIILAALDQLLEGSQPASWKQFVWRTALCFLAAGINPYVAAMTLLITSATCVQPILAGRENVAMALLGMGLNFVCAIGGLLLFGFLYSSDISQYTMSGYGYYSMNLLAPIDPGPPGSVLLKQQNIEPGQYEGYNYLGLGIVLLGLVSIARTPTILLELFRVKSAPTIILVDRI